MKKCSIISVFVVAACSGGGNGGAMDQIMQSWSGASLSEVISQWGYPNDERDVAGRRLFIWSETSDVFLPTTSTTIGTVNTYGNQSFVNANTSAWGGGMLTATCARILEVDENETVVGGQWQGNNCPFMEVGPYANWRRSRSNG